MVPSGRQQLNMLHSLVGLLITCVAFHPAESETGDILTPSHRNMAACVEETIHKYFGHDLSAVFSIPSTDHYVTAAHSLLPTGSSNSKLLELMLKNIHEEQRMPVLINNSENPIYGSMTPQKYSNYAIMLWQEEDKSHNDILEEQLDNLEVYMDSGHGTFIVVVVDFNIQSPKSLAFDITEKMWNTHKIINTLIIVPNVTETLHKVTLSSAYNNNIIFNLYTWFPYDSEQCGTVREVVLLDQWTPDNNVTFLMRQQLFPAKIPTNLMGCPIRVSTSHVVPYIIMTDNHTETYGSTRYTYRGIEIEYLLLISKALNFTVIFLPPSESDIVTARMNGLMDLAGQSTDVLIGLLPLHHYIMDFGDPTIPYIYSSVRWYVPCARPLPRMERILSVFAPPIWLTMAIVFFLTTAIFWLTGNSSFSYHVQESSCYKTLSYCFYNVWAVLMGVSVTEMPRSCCLRALFFIFVCYCFAMNTLFQAFFVTFLVEPGYEKQIETLEELIDSGASVGLHPQTQTIVDATGYEEHKKFKANITCSDYDACLARAIVENNFAIMTLQVHIEYIASTLGKATDHNKYVCSLNGNIVSGGLAMYLTKGHTLLERFNVIIQRCLEGGLIMKYWSELNWNISLKGVKEHREDSSSNTDMYFVFQLSHLGVTFSILSLGCALSFIVLLVEVTCDWKISRQTAG